MYMDRVLKAKMVLCYTYCFLKKNFFFFFDCTLQHVELPPPGIEPAPPAVETWNLNHWTAREVQNKL